MRIMLPSPSANAIEAPHAMGYKSPKTHSYTWDNGSINEEKIKKYEAFRDSMPSPMRLGIEIRFDGCTKENAKMITDAGFFLAVWDIKRRDFDEYEKLISMGVTEFTEDYHCSMGLNY